MDNTTDNTILLMKMCMMLFSMQRILILTHFENGNNRNKKRRNRRWWVRPTFRDRRKKGYFTTMYKSIKSLDPEHFFTHTRMSRVSYNYLYSILKSKLIKNSIRPPIEFECRLALTLSYLSQGVSHQVLSWSFKMGKSTVREIILETCDAIWETLSPIFIKSPVTEEFEEIARDFWELWDMPNCVGAIDGKHIAIFQPANSGSMYYNYKKFYSVVLLAVADARHRFTMVDVGAYGSQSDGGILAASDFGKMLVRDEVPLPQAKLLPNSNIMFDHYLVGDAAFQLKRNLMRPYPGTQLTVEKRTFNYRLSRARMIVENSFGVLSTRWRILLTTINAHPKNVEKIVLACVVLHNFVVTRDRDTYCPNNYVDWEDVNGEIHSGDWRAESAGASTESRGGGNRCSRDAFNTRSLLTNYFMNEGAIPQQMKFVHN